ncbi:MAG: Asp-tRNA(Asn)/Glu-tRNA(Gln) amidotransferase subunit GatB [Provencibacterium sp.]|jgi:aspartyl-tRNA(Asn)/glutamyl-tRNA(Gln) amidotransferase subunit B|nr:Asp-tRNA(Asn)/Glu-tRNA(Gln) amidotransferase subunit GatB [Provencibacterium sp.]
MEFEPVIGLEVHAQLNTETKLYCGCKNEFGGEVNSHCCEICTGMPGTLPTLNQKAVDYAIMMGHALHCTINNVCKQDRKNYFYPDLPKAYQISQADIPLCAHGYLDVVLDESCNVKRIGVTRIHIEEDAGKLLHDDSFQGTLVDFNRCGVPLIEIVSEPDMRSSSEAKAYLEAIKGILGYLDISDCKMQEGSIRCDVNVSLRPKGSETFGNRCEMKNVNSFSGAQRAIDYEIARQTEILENGGFILQETRRWDDAKGRTFPMRSKENADDYRYFPEPDLGTIVAPPEHVEELRALIPELPGEKLLRYVKKCGLTYLDANLLCENAEKYRFFEQVIELGGCSLQAAANWLNGDIARLLGERLTTLGATKLTPEKLVGMIRLIEEGKISNTAGKTVIEEIMFTQKTAGEAVEEKGLLQINDTAALEETARAVLEKNEKAVTDYRGGKANALDFLVGQCMRASGGKANPPALREILLKQLG